MKNRNTQQGFTLIELLTVIAIIALLVAILFPVFGTMREQSRQTQCLTQLHQLQVAAKLYRDDEGAFPPVLMGYAELAGGAPYVGTGQPVSMELIAKGMLYRDQVKDVNVSGCPDNTVKDKRLVTIAHIPPKPTDWPAGVSYIGDTLSGCPTDAAGVIDCYTSGPYAGQAKYFYVYDSYDIGPRVNAAGAPVLLNGSKIYDVHYRTDWTGASGLSDLTTQLKYKDPPDDRTLLTYCTHHAFTAKSGRIPVVNLGGTAKPYDVKKFVAGGPVFFK
jgi:prepilin-type N-terminal cleavage/methylation domain-containing protein